MMSNNHLFGEYLKKANKSAHLILGTNMLLTPPSLTFIFKQRLDSVCGDVLLTFLACTHWVAIPNTVSPTRFTSAVWKSTEDHQSYNLRQSPTDSRSKAKWMKYHRRESFRVERQQPAAILEKWIWGIWTSAQPDQVQWHIYRSKVGRWLAFQRRCWFSEAVGWSSCEDKFRDQSWVYRGISIK